MEIIKNRAIVSDTWQHIDNQAPIPADGDITVSLSRYASERDALQARSGAVGVRVAPGEELDPIASDVAGLPLVAVEFPKFTDGRGYTTARLLRERHGFDGELRAIGHVLRDQIFYMDRVGFDAYEIAPGKSLPDALEAFADFSVTYQPVGAR